MVLCVIFMSVCLSFAGRITIQLTDNDYDDCDPQINSTGSVVWVGRCADPNDDSEIFLYNGTEVIQLTDTTEYEHRPKISDNGHVVWTGGGIDWYRGIFLKDDSGIVLISDLDWSAYDADFSGPNINGSGHVVWEVWSRVFFYNGIETIRITPAEILESFPCINNSDHMAWIRWDDSGDVFDYEIVFYNGTDTLQLTHNTIDDKDPQINDSGKVVWRTAEPLQRDIFLYDGAEIHNLSDDIHDDLAPQISNNGTVTWYRNDYTGSDRGDYEIFLKQTSLPYEKVTDNAYDDKYPQINDFDHLVWQGFDGHDYEIFFYNGSSIIQLTDNEYDDLEPFINANDHVVWKGHDGNDYEIFLSKPYTEPEKQWAKIFGGVSHDAGFCIRQTKDKGYIIAGSTWSFGSGRAWVMKLDNDGNVLWENTYGDDHYGASVIEQTSDEGYIVAGSTSSLDPNGDMWLLKLHGDGTIDWQKSYGGSETDTATSVQQTGDGGYIVAGQTESFGAGERMDLWILKVDAFGNVGPGYPGTWQKTYGPSEGGEWGPVVRETGGGGYIVAASTYSFGAGGLDFWVLKLEADGEPEWQKTYGGDDMDSPSCIEKTGDSGYIVAGKSFSFDPGETSWDAWVIKLSATGEISWERKYDFGRDDGATAILQNTGDGNYIVTGNSSLTSPDLSDGWIMKLDGGGNIQWRKIYGGPLLSEIDHLASVDQTTDDGFVAVGFTDSFGTGDQNLWVLKLGANGQIDDCPAMKEGTTLSDTTSCTTDDTSATDTDTSITPNMTAATANPTEAHEGDGCGSISGSGFVHLPRTGQTISYHPGDDGDLRSGITWPSPRFHDNGDGTITDRLTGLMWLKDANCARTIGHDPDGFGRGGMQWTSALDFIAGINGGSFDISSCGSYSASYEDWRLPNINDLGSLANLGQPDVASWLNGQGFEQVETWFWYYWSSTTHVSADYGALQLCAADGGYTWSWKTVQGYVWPVREGQQDYPDPMFPANVWKTGQTTSYDPGDDGDLRTGVAWPIPRFTDHGDGTVTDNLTGLMWLKDADCFGALGYETTYDTIADFNANPAGYACTEYTAIHDDWRLANRTELLSLVDRSRKNPPLPEGHPFVHINPACYRSSTTHTKVDYMEWGVDLYYYGMAAYSQRGVKPFWPVRGGKHGSVCLADLDLDGDVDGIDLAVFAADYSNAACDTGESCAGDVDHDGDVDNVDLGIVVSELGKADCIH